MYSKRSTISDNLMSLRIQQTNLGLSTKNMQTTSAFSLQGPVIETVSHGDQISHLQYPPEKKLSNPVPPTMKLITSLNKSKSGIIQKEIPTLNLNTLTSTNKDQNLEPRFHTPARLINPMTQHLIQQLHPHFATEHSTIQDSTIQRLKGDLSEVFPKQMADQQNSQVTISLSGMKMDKTKPNFEHPSVDFIANRREGRRNTNISEKRASQLISSPRVSRQENVSPLFKEITIKAVNQAPVKKVVFKLDNIQFIESSYSP